VLSANLYFQNIANNFGALCYLVDSAEAEETKELLLAYGLLYLERDRQCTVEELGPRVSGWIREQFGREIQFAASDAVGKLIEKRLAVRCVVAELPRAAGLASDALPAETDTAGQAPGDCHAPAERRVVKVYDLPTVLRRLNQSWNELSPCHGKEFAGEDRLADVAKPPVVAQTPRD
jgi:hypothetical protein